jgi:hypothetical protein
MGLARSVTYIISTMVILVSTIVGCSGDPHFGELTSLADKYKTDKGSSNHRYSDVYEYFFFPVKNQVKKVFEIGVFRGASMKMFQDYFPDADIYGIDIYDVSSLNSDRIHTFIANQSKRDQLQKCIAAFGSDFDVIVDDGGHAMDQQQISFGFLFPYVKSGGYYIIEDLHTSLLEGYGVRNDGGNSTLTMVDQYIRTGKIESDYLTTEEKKYLNRNLLYCNLLSRNAGKSITGIFKKK